MKICQAELLLELLQEVQDLRLDRDVQGGNRFVADDQLRFHGQRAGDTDALPAAAVQLVGIAVDQPLRQADGFHQLQDPVFDLRFGPVLPAHLHAFRDRLHHGFARIQRREGILENDLHVRTAFPQFPAAELKDILPVENDLSGGRLDQPEDAAPGRGFSAAGFADDAESSALLQGEGDIVDRVQHAAAGFEVFFQV